MQVQEMKVMMSIPYQKEAVVKKRFLKIIMNLVIHGAKTSQVFGRMFILQNLL